MYPAYSDILPHDITCSHILPKAFIEMNIEPDKEIILSKNILSQLKDSIVYLVLGLNCGKT